MESRNALNGTTPPAAKDRSEGAKYQYPIKRAKGALLGSIGAAVAASLCCAAPLVFLLLGLGGAWLSYLTWLAPLRPLFMLLAIIALAWAFRRIYSPRAKDACGTGQYCENPQTRRLYRAAFWTTLLLTGLLLASPELLVMIYS